jgi:hypothetical protein
MDPLEREMEEAIAALPTDRIFVAYRRPDVERANRVREALERLGFKVDCWDPERPFDDPVRSIARFIDEAWVVVVLRFTEDSGWIEAEAEYAVNSGANVLFAEPSDDPDGIAAKVVVASKQERLFVPLWDRHAYVRNHMEGKVDPESWTKTQMFENYKQWYDKHEATGPVVMLWMPCFMAVGLLLSGGLFKIVSWCLG